MILYARQHGVTIQHNMNGREKRVGHKKAEVDGYIASTDTVIEFQVTMQFVLRSSRTLHFYFDIDFCISR